MKEYLYKERSALKVDIGLNEKDRMHLAQGLCQLLADTYLLSIKTQNFHWNVTGPHFPSLYAMFGDQYLELSQGANLLAERIRALGFFAPGGLKFFQIFGKVTAMPEDEGNHPVDVEMVKHLTHDHQHIIRELRETANIARTMDDDVTVDILVQRSRAHEKAAWKLRTITDIEVVHSELR